MCSEKQGEYIVLGLRHWPLSPGTSSAHAPLLAVHKWKRLWEIVQLLYSSSPSSPKQDKQHPLQWAGARRKQDSSWKSVVLNQGQFCPATPPPVPSPPPKWCLPILGYFFAFPFFFSFKICCCFSFWEAKDMPRQWDFPPTGSPSSPDTYNLQQSGWGHARAGKWELSLALPPVWQRPNYLSHHLLLPRLCTTGSHNAEAKPGPELRHVQVGLLYHWAKQLSHQTFLMDTLQGAAVIKCETKDATKPPAVLRNLLPSPTVRSYLAQEVSIAQGTRPW